MKAFYCIDLWQISTYKLCISTLASFADSSGLFVTRRAWCYSEKLVRWIFGIIGFQRFEEWLGVLVVNDVMFSYRSFFSREVLGKRRGLSTSCGASPWVECDVVSSFSETLLKQQFAFSQLSIWSLHPIYHHIHCVIITRSLLFFQRHTNGHYGGFLCHNRVWRTETIFVKRAGEAWLHRWCDDIPSNPSELQEENNFLQ
jgi:hypothetical protein